MSAAASIPVTIDTFARAETDLYFSNFVRDGGDWRRKLTEVPIGGGCRLPGFSGTSQREVSRRMDGRRKSGPARSGTSRK